MIRVQMTSSLKERPPKIAGLLTVRQLIFCIIALAVVIPVFKLMKNMDFAVRFLVALLAAAPILFVGFMPQGEFSPLKAIKHFIVSLFRTKIRTHDGNNGFYQETPEKNTRISRHRSYKGYY